MIRGRRFWGDHTPVAGQQFDYAFDDTCPVRETCRSHRNAAALRPALAWSPARESLSHGVNNRQTTLAGGDQTGGNQRSATYASDFLNRYSSRTVPATFDVLGLATATSAVTVNSQTAYRKGEYFRREVTASNSSAPDWEGVTVSVSGVSSVTGNVWVPQTPEAYTYDDDGNTLTDGRWTYTWDAENRLVRLVARTANGPQQRIDFEYDHASRRIRKKLWNNTAGTGSPAVDLKFIYDGWNLMAEVDSADALVRQYMWGTDLSGTAQGAGGVGGLVKIYDHASSKTYFPGYDGNGNVAVLVDGDTGAAGAVYEYGPFGELIRSSGTYAATNPFRFSTKYQDKETDLLYYGYRYYNPSTGRWISRDPIEERGGKALYTIALNNPISRIDVLGLYGESGHFYTTYIVARAAGRTHDVAYALAYYSQLPDEHPAFEAKFSLLGTGFWGLPIQEELHSLHGTDPKKRRACLKRMIKGQCGGPLRTWEKGFLIHAFADSYAHTNPETGLLFESPFGHLDLNRAHLGHEYDWISERPRLYMQYMWDLFDALGGTNWFADELKGLVNLLSQIKEGDTEETTVRAFRQLALGIGYDKGYFPEDTDTIHDAINQGHVTTANWLPVPSLWEVRDLIAKIRKCCGCDH